MPIESTCARCRGSRLARCAPAARGGRGRNDLRARCVIYLRVAACRLEGPAAQPLGRAQPSAAAA
eukprot:5479987-Alexandrium_andersonii.AAC.1